MKTEKKRRRLWVASGLLLFVAVLLLTPWSRAGAVEPQMATGGYHTVGLKSDGTVVAVGDNTYGQRDVNGTDWTDIVAVAGGTYHTVGLKSDGTVVGVGYNIYGQRDVNGTGWTDIVAVAAGYWHTVGLKSDGTGVAVGGKHLRPKGYRFLDRYRGGGGRRFSYRGSQIGRHGCGGGG